MMRSNSMSRRGERFGRVAAIAAGMIALGAFGLGCAGGSMEAIGNRLQPGPTSVPEGSALISAGEGVLMRTIDGGAVEKKETVASAGMRSIRVDVRRSLRDIKDDRLTNVYSVGSCRLRLSVQSGSRYRLEARPFTTRRLQFDEASGPQGEEREIIGVTVHVLDDVTGGEWVAPPDSCSLRLDCTRINRELLRAGDGCTITRRGTPRK